VPEVKSRYLSNTTARNTPLFPSKVALDLRRLGVESGDTVMVHASLRAIGPVEGGAGGVLEALEHAVGPRGTLLMTLGARADEPFDASTTPADPDVGYLAEAFRRRAGTLVTDHPEGRFGARGGRAGELLMNPPWHDYYGPGSALERLCRWGGRVLRLGADLETTTLLHYAEYLAPLAEKRRVRRHRRVVRDGAAVDVHVDCLDDEHGIVDYPDGDYFGRLLTDYLAEGRARTGAVGGARSELIDANDLLTFGVRWMTARLGPPR